MDSFCYQGVKCPVSSACILLWLFFHTGLYVSLVMCSGVRTHVSMLVTTCWAPSVTVRLFWRCCLMVINSAIYLFTIWFSWLETVNPIACCEINKVSESEVSLSHSNNLTHCCCFYYNSYLSLSILFLSISFRILFILRQGFCI